MKTAKIITEFLLGVLFTMVICRLYHNITHEDFIGIVGVFIVLLLGVRAFLSICIK